MMHNRKQQDSDRQQQSDLLKEINSPVDLKDKTPEQLRQIAVQARQLIMETVTKTGGHLASNLGTVELTIALHRVFDFSRDRLFWDVGHQCYTHKILTGRKDKFNTLRQKGGLSGYPSPTESDYDLFIAGHAGTAISTAMGLAWANQHFGGNDRKIVAVVGDAAIVNGLSLEAVNNIGLLKRQFLVVLNDNSMAIDATQGTLARLLDRIRLTRTYSDIKHSAKQLITGLPLGEEITQRLERFKEGLRAAVHGQQLFEALGFRYFGPVDGHDIDSLLEILEHLANLTEPVILHVHTQKGHGCEFASKHPSKFHSVSGSQRQANIVESSLPGKLSWTEAFSRAILQRARNDERIITITAAMADGTGLAAVRDALPEQYLDVGMNESHAVAMAAGLAKAGLKPIVAIYSTFLQRAFDQIFHEVSLQELGVLFCLDRAGLVGSDGPTHHGLFDLAYLRILPGLVVMAPADEAELSSAIDFALSSGKPAAIRYPRDEIPSNLPAQTKAPFLEGQPVLLREGNDGTILALGAMVENALSAAEMLSKDDGIEISVFSARFVKPMHEETICEIISGGKPVITVEDHALIGGFGSAVLETAAKHSLDTSNVTLLGVPDRFIAHATREEQLAEVGTDPEGIAKAVRRCVSTSGGVNFSSTR